MVVFTEDEADIPTRVPTPRRDAIRKLDARLTHTSVSYSGITPMKRCDTITFYRAHIVGLDLSVRLDF